MIRLPRLGPFVSRLGGVDDLVRAGAQVQPGQRDWELRLEPPVNRILPVSRVRAESLWFAYVEKRRSIRAEEGLY